MEFCGEMLHTMLRGSEVIRKNTLVQFGGLQPINFAPGSIPQFYLRCPSLHSYSMPRNPSHFHSIGGRRNECVRGFEDSFFFIWTAGDAILLLFFSSTHWSTQSDTLLPSFNEIGETDHGTRRSACEGGRLVEQTHDQKVASTC